MGIEIRILDFRVHHVTVTGYTTDPAFEDAETTFCLVLSA